MGEELADIYNRDFNNTVLKKFSVPDIDPLPQRLPRDQTPRPPEEESFPGTSRKRTSWPTPWGPGKTFRLRHHGHGDAPPGDGQETAHRGSERHRPSVRQGLPAALSTANILIPNKRQLATENRKKLISQVVTGNLGCGHHPPFRIRYDLGEPGEGGRLHPGAGRGAGKDHPGDDR